MCFLPKFPSSEQGVGHEELTLYRRDREGEAGSRGGCWLCLWRGHQSRERGALQATLQDEDDVVGPALCCMGRAPEVTGNLGGLGHAGV